MPALFFPNLNALRLALTSGLVPPGVSRAPAAAGFDAQGRLWLVPAEVPPRESLAALARIGVQALGEAGVSTETVGCWGELLPLRAAPEPAAGSVLFVVPDRRLGSFVSRLRRFSRADLGIALRDEPPGLAWLVVRDAPAAVLLEVAEPDSTMKAYCEQAPGVWVRHGWQHPAPDHFSPPPGHVLLLDPPQSVTAVPGNVPVPDADEFRVPMRNRGGVVTPPRPPAISARLTLARRDRCGREALWILGTAAEAEFWAYCAAADERLVRRLEAAAVGNGTETRLVVRMAGGKRAAVFPNSPGVGFTSEGRVEGLFVPADRILRPNLRVRELSRALGTRPDRIVWVEPGPDGGVIHHAVPVVTFRPLTAFLEHAAPAASALPVPARADPFPLARFVGPSDLPLFPEPEPPAGPELLPEESIDLLPDDESDGPGWLRRSLRKLAARFRHRRERPADRPPVDRLKPEDGRPAGPRVERNLDSPDALLHGPDWSGRRRELEARLFREWPRLGPDGRGRRWADLAAVYTATGNPNDAAVCWLNAAWESPAPPPAWFDQWLAAECRAARLTDRTALDRWLSEPGRPGVGRVVAAFTAKAGLGGTAPPGFLAALPRVLAILDHHFDDLPLRAAWLARLAAARLCDGDALGLARWADRVSARLLDHGPGLDLDEPSFLRFHGTASADRFQAAREWLVGVRKPVLEWVRKHGGGRLQAEGLDAETEATAVYAEFMLAWGLGCLGERVRAKDWAARARKDLARKAAPGADPAAHALLGDLFLRRVRAAQEGLPPRAGLPADLRKRLDGLDDYERYAVDKLREHSRILEPADRIGAYRGTDLRSFWGTDRPGDRLGERLFVLAGRTDPGQLAEEAEALLGLCATRPAPDTVPRVAFTLLELAPRLDPVLFLPRVLDLLPVALDWAESWLAALRWRADELPRKLAAVRARMLGAGFAAAGGLPPATAGPAAAGLVGRVLGGGEAVRGPLLTAAGSVFRALRRLGLRGEAEAAARFLDPGEGEPTDPEHFPADRLGVAAGWFAAGNEDAGNRILDDARAALRMTVPQPTDLVLAYADALAFAPPGIARGRLGEIFQLVDRLSHIGSNRYYTLKLLQVIDAVVRAVVADDFALGPAVRTWLADDEFLIRGRVRRDLTVVLREQGIG